MTLSARNWAWDVQTRPRRPEETPKPGDDPVRVRLKPGEKLVLLCIAEHENAEEGIAYPSYETIAEKTHLSVRAVQDHVKTLAAASAFAIKRRRRRDGKWYRHTYVLDVPERYRERDPAWQQHQG
ncbi:DNA-binding MarR family transcriptional regulator [Frigoribacterium sp. PvP120]|uniref:helix-turn-helix domain-containing protein n=1 Tax=unclassified Frigoribacterium TaxID=2627005 RepID=UPI001AE8531F|nr:helix-turn-helix domain-containing protein [Frigoribacterium sp. PvP121]MBP1241723.1 DNA-binding MarR family transcriptional regulator [Frigoribacterium sp. PvP121]